MSNATNSHKIQNTLQVLDELSLSMWDASLPVGALDITLSDEHKNHIELSLDEIIYQVEKHMKRLSENLEKQALQNWLASYQNPTE